MQAQKSIGLSTYQLQLQIRLGLTLHVAS